jgi:hypothetical protein
MKGNRLCEICGARVANLNPKTTTCGPVCTRAKHNGLTRALQIKRDLRTSAALESGFDVCHPVDAVIIGSQQFARTGCLIDYGRQKAKFMDGEEIA